jgi:hypothetical protein
VPTPSETRVTRPVSTFTPVLGGTCIGAVILIDADVPGYLTRTRPRIGSRLMLRFSNGGGSAFGGIGAGGSSTTTVVSSASESCSPYSNVLRLSRLRAKILSG